MVEQKNILDYFGLSSQKELVDFMNNNPKDEKVIELKEVLTVINSQSGGQKNG